MSDAEKLLAWMREPDYAESFSIADMAEWVNRRPIAEAMRILLEGNRLAVAENRRVQSLMDQPSGTDDLQRLVADGERA